MRLFAALCLFAVAAMVPNRASATVGGPSTLELLGYAPVDGKVYLLRRYEDDSGRIPQLIYVPLRGKSRGREVEVTSWYTADRESDAARQALQERLERLKARLQRPAAKRPRVHLRAWKRRDIKWTAPYDATLSKPGERWRVRVNNADATKTGAGTLDSYGCLEPTGACTRVRVDRAATLPAANATIVIVESVGIPDEVGYRHQRAILLTPRAGSTP